MIEHQDAKAPDTKAVGRYEHTGPDRTGSGLDDLPKLLVVERDVTELDRGVYREPRNVDSNRHNIGGHGRRRDDPDPLRHILDFEVRRLKVTPAYWEVWESEWTENEGGSQRISDWRLTLMSMPF
jgi:hypothetical protein